MLAKEVGLTGAASMRLLICAFISSSSDEGLEYLEGRIAAQDSVRALKPFGSTADEEH